MPKYRIKSDILGVDFGIQTDQKLTERDYFDILKTKVSPQKMLRAYKNNKDDEKVQALATKALDNNYFEGADFGTGFSEGAKSFGRGVKNMFVTNIYGTSRLLDATMQYGEADESQKYDELVEEGIKKAGQQLKGLSYASKRTDRTIEDDLSQALQFAGLSEDDENLKKRVIAEARRQDNSQAEATRAQMGVDAVGMMSMLGAKLFQGLGDAKDIATGEVSFGGDSKKRKLRQLDYLIEQDYIGRTIERGAELGLQLGGAISTISQIYTGMDLSPFEKNEEALRDVKSGLVKPDRDVAMLGSMFADPGMGATVLASGGLAFGRNFIARGAIIKTGQKAAQESALKSTIAQLSDIANPTNTQKTLLKTAEKNLAKVTGSGEKLEKLVAKAEGIAQAEAGKLLQKGQGNTPMAARLFQAIDKAPPPKAPFSNRMTGKILEKAGISAEYLGRTIEFLQRLPEETLGTLFMRSGMDEQAAMTASRATARTLQGTAAAGVVTGGFNEFSPELENLGLALLLAPGGSSLVTRFGHDAAILGKQLQYAQTSSPLFQRIAQLDPADSSLTAVTLDRTSALTIPGTISGLAEGIFAKSRQFGPSPALKAPATALTRTGLGNTLTGAVNATKTAVGASAIPGAIGYAVDGEAGAGGAIAASIPFIAAGLGFGTLARYGSQADVRAKMLGDQAYYKDTYLTDTEVGMYDSLAKPVRQAIATSVIQNPDVVYRFQNDRGNSHWSVENGESVVTIFTKSAPQEQLSAVLGHEIAHHIDAFGFMPQILEQLVGSVEKNQPGLFTEYKNGKPVIIKDAEGRDVYATNKEFAKHRQRYLDRLEQSGVDKNSPDYQAYANNDARIAREIFASHGAAWYFGGDFVTRNYQGAGAKMMGAILDPLFSSPGLRKFFHRIGLATEETTGLVADPLRLFPELKEIPALTRMIEKYNDDVRGFGPQARREGRGRGNLVDPEFADEIATASLTAKDLENPAIVNRLKAGGVVKIKDDGSIETDASGKPVFLPSREVNKKNKQLSQDILQIIRKKEDAGETFGEGHVSMEKTADGKERASGRFIDPSTIDELAKTGKYNPHQLAALKQISQTLRNNTGDVWNLFYYSALKWNKAGRKVYGQIKGGDRKSLPFGIEITKDGNINIQTISVDAFKKNLEWFAKSKGYEKKMSEAFGGMNAWENAQNAYKLLPIYLQNHMKGIINGEKGSGINPLQRDLINAAIGRVNADQVKANPILEGLGDRRSQRQQSIRSRRLDRIGNAIRGESGFPALKNAIEQNKVPMYMPGRGEGDKLFMPADTNDPQILSLREQLEFLGGDEMMKGFKAQRYLNREETIDYLENLLTYRKENQNLANKLGVDPEKKPLRANMRAKEQGIDMTPYEQAVKNISKYQNIAIERAKFRIQGGDNDILYMPGENTYARPLEEILQRIPEQERFIGNKPAGMPVTRPNGKPFLELDLNEKIGPLGVKQSDIDRIMQESFDESGPAANRAFEDMKSKGTNMVPPDATHWKNVESRTLRDRFWYEISSEAMSISFPDHLGREGEMVKDMTAATSPLADPNYNSELMISIMSEYERGDPSVTPAVVQKSIADVFSGDFGKQEARKVGSFGQTFKFIAGDIDSPPLPTNDRQVAASFDIPDAAFGQYPVLYEVVARFYNKLRDHINQQRPNDPNGPFQSYQLQAPSWVQTRAELKMKRNKNMAEEEIFEGDAYANAFKKAAQKLRNAGLRIKKDPKTGLPIFTKKVLADPRVVEVLSPLAVKFRQNKFGTMEIVTLLHDNGKKFAELYDQSLALGEKTNIRDADDLIRVSMKLLTNRRIKDKETGKKIDKPSLITELAQAITQTNKEITRLELGKGTFEGAMSQNIRIPMDNIPVELHEVYLAMLGDPFLQAAQAASLFKVSNIANPDTFSVFVKGASINDPNLKTFAEHLSSIGHEANLSQRPNGLVIDVNPMFLEDFSTQAIDIANLQNLVNESFPNYVSKIAGIEYDSTYIERSDYKKIINNFKNRKKNENIARIREATGFKTKIAGDILKGGEPAGFQTLTKAKRRRVERIRAEYNKFVRDIKSAQSGLRKAAKQLEKDTGKLNTKLLKRLDRLAKQKARQEQKLAKTATDWMTSFMPAVDSVQSTKPVNRINQTNFPQRVNPFMLPAVSAGAKSAERFR